MAHKSRVGAPRNSGVFACTSGGNYLITSSYSCLATLLILERNGEPIAKVALLFPPKELESPPGSAVAERHYLPMS
jgi:hypothetical protein